MPPVVIAGGIVAAAGITSALVGANAASKASEAQTNAMNGALAYSNAKYQDSQKNLQPFIHTGQQANQILQNGMAPGGPLTRQFTQADFETSPDYNFIKKQAMDAMGNSLSVKGGAISGMAARSQGLSAANIAAGAFGSAQGAFQKNQAQTQNLLTTVAGHGAQAAESLGGLGTQAANQNMNGASYSGNAQAAGTIGSAKALQSGINAVGQGIGGMFGQPTTPAVAGVAPTNLQQPGVMDMNGYQTLNANQSYLNTQVANT